MLAGKRASSTIDGKPEMDGIEATKTIRMIPGYESIPIIAMTAHAFAEDRQSRIEVGMNDHL